MSIDHYLSTYLSDIIGMTPKEATNYLGSSLVDRYFRSMRVVVDVAFDPDVHQSDKSYSGKIRATFAPEEFEQGRVTVRLKDGAITNAQLEHGYLHLCPIGWQRVPLVEVQDSGVFFLGKVTPVGGMPIRREIETTPDRKFRGWTFSAVGSEHVVNRSSHPQYAGEKVKPQPYAPVRFEGIPWR